MKETKFLPWDQWLDAIQDESLRAPFVQRARELAQQPIFERVYRLEDVGQKGRSWLDGRYRNGPPEVWATFALSMQDASMSFGLLEELPVIAAAARFTGEAGLTERCVAQLQEVATWSPLQRPGWTLFGKDAKPLADPKGDGNWLATGNCIVAIVESLQMLPRAAVPAELRAKLEALLAAEIVSCVDDWNAKRPWFYRWQNPLTNQWVLPTAGFLLASAFLGREQHRDTYELGVEHLLTSLDAYGAEGAQVEGLGYGSFTIVVLLRAARWLAAEGDDRLLAHPFLKNFPRWLVHHHQPVGFSINAFDNGGPPQWPVSNGKRQSGISVLFGLCALTGNLDARWAVHHALDGQVGSFGWLMAKSTQPPPADYAPPLWAQYDRTRRVNWRSAWDEVTASGVWVRGCHPDDQHSHADHGHVNFIHHGRVILIEAGACVYHSPVGITHFSSGFGHNVLTLGAWTPANANPDELRKYPPGMPNARGNVPLTVAKLDATGGDVTLDATSSYKDALRQWTRRVVWDAERMRVEDHVIPATPDIITFRWHLGTRGTPAVTGVKVTWPEGELEIVADVPVTIAIEQLSDNTLAGAKPDENALYPLHACVVVRTTQREAKCRITTNIRGI